MRKRKHSVTLEYNTEVSSNGKILECLYATCDVSHVTVGPIWGASEASELRALVELREECDPSIWHSND